MTFSDQIDYACLTDVGVRRSHNQDNHAVLLAAGEEQWAQIGHLFLVADGMGAHAVGEKASEQAVHVIPHTYHKHSLEGPANALRKALSEANASIYAFGKANPEFQGSGTTGTALVLRPDGAWVGHVGDSRAYRVRDGYIDQLSYDHSKVWEYARLKRIDPAEVKDIASNVIYRCLGPEPFVEIDIEGPHSINASDTFVLCSDGLSGPVNDREIGAVVTALPPAEACRFLIHLANLRGGPDNITVLVVRVNGTPDLASVAPAAPNSTPRLHPVPWPLVSLIAGTLLAAAAITLHTLEIRGAMGVFLVGSFTIVTGLIGLFRQAHREHANPFHPKKAPGVRIHRRTACSIEPSLLDKLSKAIVALRQLADEKRWESDWAAVESFRAEAEKHRACDNLSGAFRAYCRALLPLAEAAHERRNKAEEFKPLWDIPT